MIMKTKVSIFISFIFFCSLSANSFTIDSILDSIASNNLELKSGMATLQNYTSEVKSSNNLGDTEVGFGYMNGDNISGQKYEVSVSQGFDWPGLYIARSKANDAKIKAAEYEYQSKKLDILLQAKLLCINIISTNQKINIQTNVYNNIKQLYDEYYKGYNHGEISILDINKLKIELLNVKQNLDKIHVEKQKLIEELISLNNNQGLTNIESLSHYPAQELSDFNTYESQAKTLSPQYSLYAKLSQSSQKEVSVAKMGWLPKFSIGYKYANELGDKFNGVSVGLSMPLFSNINKVNKAKYEQLSINYEQQNYLTQEISNIKNNYAKVVYLKEQIHSYNSVLSDSSNTEMLKKALEGGQISLLNYLLELRYFLEAQQTLLNLEYEYNTILAELNKYSLLL